MSNLISNHPLVLQILMDQELYAIPGYTNKTPIAETSIPNEEVHSISTQSSNVEEIVPQIEKESIDLTKLKCFGNKESKTLILVSDQKNAVCADSERELFKNICTAMNWNANQYVIVNTAQNIIYSAHTWLETFKPEKMILFDIPQKEFDMEIPFNHLLKKENQLQIIKTQSLSTLNQHKDFKLTFWMQLKMLKS